MQVQARLTGGHKAAITRLVTLPAKEAGAPDALISASADGTIALWQPSTSAIKLPDKEIAPKMSFKAHDNEILSAVLIAAPSDSPEAGQLNLVTSGEVLHRQAAAPELRTLQQRQPHNCYQLMPA